VRGGSLALEIPEAYTSARGSRSTGTGSRHWSGIGYFRGPTSTVGHLSRFMTTIHCSGPPPSSVIPLSLHAFPNLSTHNLCPAIPSHNGV